MRNFNFNWMKNAAKNTQTTGGGTSRRCEDANQSRIASDPIPCRYRVDTVSLPCFGYTPGISGRLMKYAAMVTLLLTLACGQAWGGETILKEIDFTTATWSGTTFSQGNTTTPDVINGITFYAKNSSSGNNFSYSTDHLVFPGSNYSSSNYVLGFPITGIVDGMITIRVWNGTTAKAFKYNVIADATEFASSHGDGIAATTGVPGHAEVGSINATKAYVYIGCASTSDKNVTKIVVSTPARTTLSTSSLYESVASTSKSVYELINGASYPDYLATTINAVTNRKGWTSSVSTPHDYTGVNSGTTYYFIKTANGSTITLRNIANVKSVRFYGNGDGTSANITTSVSKVSGSGSNFSVSNITFDNSNKVIAEYTTGDMTGLSGYDAGTYYNYTFTFGGAFDLWGIYVETAAAPEPSCGETAQAALTLSSNSGTICGTGTATFTVSGGSGEGTLSVSSSDETKATASIDGSTVTVTGVAAGSATITVTKACDATYAEKTATYSATVAAAPSANAGVDKVTEPGTGVALAATAAASGCTGAWTIQSGPSTSSSQLSSTSSATATFTPTAAGTYTLRWTVTNSTSGCSAYDEMTVKAAICSISECGNATLTYPLNVGTSLVNTAANLVSTPSNGGSAALTVPAASAAVTLSTITISDKDSDKDNNGKAAAKTSACYPTAPTMSSKIGMYNGASYSLNNYLQFAFTVNSGYTFTPCDIQFTVQPVSNIGNFRWEVTDGTDVYGYGVATNVPKGSDGGASVLTGLTSTEEMEAGDYYIRLYPYYNGSNTFRISNNVILKGTTASAAPSCSDETGLAYGTGTVNKTYGDASFTNTLTNSNSLSVTYSSDDTDVATVNESTGAVTIVGAGSTTIRASWAGNSTYCEDEVYYTLNVKPAVGSVSGAWDRFGGETISLSVSPSGGSSYTYQWQKWYNDQWNDISNGTSDGVVTTGATSDNLQIANCTYNNSGSYRCVVTSGGQTNETNGYQVKVYVLECYNGGTTVYNFTRDGENQRGSVDITLSASTSYEFKVHVDNDYYGNNGTVNSDITNWVMCNNDNEYCNPNLHVNSGLGGTFTFTVDYSDDGASSVVGEPEVSITYPRKRIYLSPGVWDADGAKFAYNYWRDGVSAQWTDFLTSDDCGKYADIPQWNGVAMIAVRLNNTTTTPNWDDKWNQTGDLTITSNDYIVVSDWDNITYNSTYSLPTYTISYNAGTNGSGSKSDETKTCGVDFTLPSSAVFTRNGYTQTGWTTSDGGDQTHELGGSYTVNDDQTFYPVWTGKTYTITYYEEDKETLIDGLSPTSYTCGEGATLPTPDARACYTFDGWYKSTCVDGGSGFDSSCKRTKIDDDAYGNYTFYGKWTLNSHTLTWNFNGGTTEDSYTAGGSVNCGTTLDYPDPITKTGYTFSAWSSTPTEMPDDDLTLTASWTANKYTVTLDPDNGNSTSTVSATYDAAMPGKLIDGETDVVAPTYSGYAFGGYFDDHAGNGNQYYTNAVASANNWDKTSATTLYAKWTQTVTLKTGSQGSGSDLTPTVAYKGTALSGFSSGHTAKGYRLLGYYTASSEGTKVLNADGTFAASSVTDYITDGKWTKANATTLYAQWEDMEITMPGTLNKANNIEIGGGLSFDGDYFNYGEGGNSHLDGYAEWKVNVAQKCVYTVTIDGNYTSTGRQWEMYLVNGSGTTISTRTFGKDYTSGDLSYTENWDLSGIAATGTYIIRLKNITEWGAGKVLSVAIDPIKVTYDANGGTCATEYAYYAGSALTLPTPEDRDGYVFEGWYNGATKVGNAGGSYSPTASITLTAKWAVIVDMPNTLTKDNVAVYSSDMTWHGDDDEYFDYGPTSAQNLGRWAKWEVNVVPGEYTISMVGGFPDVGSNAIQWGLILFDGADTVATYNSIRKDGYEELTYAAKWDLTQDKAGNALAEGVYTLEVKNIIAWGQPKLKSLTLDVITVTYDANGGTCATESAVYGGSALTLPTPTRVGYTFEGWYNAGTKIGNAGAEYTPTADITLYAHWTDNISGKVFSYIDGNYGDVRKSFDGTTVSDNATGKDKTFTDGSTGVKFIIDDGAWDNKTNNIATMAKLVNGTTKDSIIIPTGKIATVNISFASYTGGTDYTLQVNGSGAGHTTTGLTDGMTNAQVESALKDTTLSNKRDTLVLTSKVSKKNLYIGRVSATITGYVITYAAGDYGSGSLAAGTKTVGSNYTISSTDDAFTRTNCVYDGWSTNANGSTKDYNFGDTYSTDAALTLYPHWVATCSTPADPTGFSAGSITDGGVTFSITDDGDAGNYDIYYSTSSTAPTGSTTPTTTATAKSKEVTGLSAATTYYAWVRAVCDETHKSDWVALNPDGDTHTFMTHYTITIGDVTTRQHDGETVGGTISSDVSHAAEGGTVTLTATPTSGYGFVEWTIEKTSDNSDVTSSVLEGNTLTMPDYGVTVKAIFAKRYSITYKDHDKSTVLDLSPTYYLYGTGVPALPTPVKVGYVFDGWYSAYCVDTEHSGDFDEGCKTTSIGTSDYGSATYYASWTAKYSVTYDGDSPTTGSAPAGGSNYDGGETITVVGDNSMTKTGYTFRGWKYNGTFYLPGQSFTMPAANVTLTAVWEPNSTDVTLFSTDFSAAAWSGITSICSGKNAEDEVHNGITFHSYSSDNEGKPFAVDNSNGTLTWCNNNMGSNYWLAIPVTDVNGSLTITVDNGSSDTRFKYVIKQETSISGSGGSGTANSSSASDPATYTKSDCSKSDYVVYLGRQGSDYTTLTSIAITTPGTDGHFDVSFADQTGFGGTSSLPSTIYGVESGLKILQVSNPTATGYTFGGWYTDASCETAVNWGMMTITADKTLYAKWTAKTTTVTINANTGNHGSTAPSAFTATYGQALPEFTAATGVSGWRLTGYYDAATNGAKVIDADGTFSSNGGVWNRLDGDALTLYAQYEEALYTITYNANGGSCATSTAKQASFGEELTLPTPTWSGYTFDGWYNAGSKIGDAGDSYAPTADISLYAKWTDNIDGKVFSYVDGNYGDKCQKFDGTGWATTGVTGINKTFTNATTGVQFVITKGAVDYKSTGIISSFAKYLGNSDESTRTGMSVVIPAGYIATVKILYGAYNTGNDYKLTVNGTAQAAPASSMTDAMTSVSGVMTEVTLENQTGTLALSIAKTNGKNLYIARVSATITGYQTLTYVGGTGSNWNTTANWSPACLPTIEHDVVLNVPVEVNIDHAVAKSIVIDQNGHTGSLTIQANKGLEVAGKVQVWNGSALSATTPSDLLLESSSAGNATLIFDNSNSDQATVQMYSKGWTTGEQGGGTWNWQTVGVPVTDATRMNDYYGGYMYEWSSSGWVDKTDMYGALTPFTAYSVSYPTGDAEHLHTYSIDGTLVPTGDKSISIPATTSVMALANSWTAPIHISDIEFTSSPANIFLYNTGYNYKSAATKADSRYAPGTYLCIPKNSAPYLDESYIAPMQGFYVKNKLSSAGTITINYNTVVRPSSDRAIVSGAMHAPKRTMSNLSEPAVLKMYVSDSQHDDRLVLLEREDFSRGFDNGWDGEKFQINAVKTAPRIFAINETGGKESVSAIPELENTVIGFRPGKEETYTIRFEYNGDETLYLRDTRTGSSTLITNESKYIFLSDGTNEDARFIIVRVQSTPTGTEEISAGSKAYKLMIEDHIYIIRDGRMYSVDGALVNLERK